MSSMPSTFSNKLSLQSSRYSCNKPSPSIFTPVQWTTMSKVTGFNEQYGNNYKKYLIKIFVSHKNKQPDIESLHTDNDFYSYVVTNLTS